MAAIAGSVIERIPDAGGRLEDVAGRARDDDLCGIDGRASRTPGRAGFAGDGDEVAEDGRRRRGTAGTGTVEPDATDRRPVDLDAVADAGRPAERRIEPERGRQDRSRDLAVIVRRRGREQPDDAAGPARIGLVGEADARDAGTGRSIDTIRAGRQGGRVEPAVERQPGEDDQLVRGVMALDIARRIGLRVAEPLRLRERRVVVEWRGLVGHGGQDEVGRAVDDASDALDPVAREVAGQGPEDRDPAADRGFEAERGTRPPGDPLELRAMVGDDVLVGGDHALAHRQRRGDERVSGLVATHQLDDDVDPLVGHEMGRGIGQESGWHARGDRPARIAHGDGDELESRAVCRTKFVRPFVQCGHDLASDGPGTEDGHAQPGTAHDGPWAGCGIGRMVADGSRRPPGERGRLHSLAMTTELAPATAPLDAPAARPRIFSGIQPSGIVHLGNELGAVRNYVKLQSEYEAIYCIVDYHALTSTHDAHVLRTRTREMAASLLALGLDPDRCTLFVQSHRPEVTELAWLLATVTPVSWLERTPTYKEKREQQSDDINHGLLTYPVLQAADIVIYKATLVPVGKDQAAHLELSREIVRAFNMRYGDTFPEPQAVFTEAPTVLGTDGVRKMSKSVGNTIDVLAPPEVIRKQVMSMVTDTKRVLRSDPGRPEVCNVCQLQRSFGDDYESLWDGERTARTGCVDMKRVLSDRIVARYAEPRERYLALMADPAKVDEILAAGAERIRPIAEATMSEVREKMGLR